MTDIKPNARAMTEHDKALVERLRYDCHLATQLGDDARIVLPAIDARTIISRIEAQAVKIEWLRKEINRTHDKAYWAGVEDGKRAALEQSK